MVNVYGVFRDYCKVRPSEILYTLIATAASNLVFSWVVRVGEFCHPELPGNAKIVYMLSHIIAWTAIVTRPSQ